ncbi:hypothetical protein CHS0354_022552 [Potamilus streckersoni]|uniref:Cyclin N-terminal domain-containing protein n=1 Tax=Potamilus streckersoni TaxID=2493646 RepID=A0AAE0TCJ9_9BIVA|nr:hypothetical protein CHS0354_022552 [Potamilus streckersoni]
MSRKSARLLSRSNTEPCGHISRKRKSEEDPEGAMESSKKRQQYRIENQWIPISETTAITTCALIPNQDYTPPQDDGSSSPDFFLRSRFRFRNYLTTPISLRESPFPAFSWADSKDVWQSLLKKELNYHRDSRMFDKHPALQARMRAILLDWLTEVCEVYRLHRETFYLATDFIDRFLSVQKYIQKHVLQLIGITALFIASKLEEIYPPKLSEFAFVTDGACTENEILDQELVILKTLNWDLSPVTASGWLNVYLQVANMEHIPNSEHGFVYPQYSSHVFVQIARLLDLCILDVQSLQFSYSVLAASAICHLASREIALQVSGFKWIDILPCVHWMAPYAATVRELGPLMVKFFSNVPSEDSHNIQTHAVDLNLLEKAQSMHVDFHFADRSSPDLKSQVLTQLTPPQSDKKHPNIDKQHVSPSECS